MSCGKNNEGVSQYKKIDRSSKLYKTECDMFLQVASSNHSDSLTVLPKHSFFNTAFPV